MLRDGMNVETEAKPRNDTGHSEEEELRQSRAGEAEDMHSGNQQALGRAVRDCGAALLSSRVPAAVADEGGEGEERGGGTECSCRRSSGSCARTGFSWILVDGEAGERRCLLQEKGDGAQREEHKEKQGRDVKHEMLEEEEERKEQTKHEGEVESEPREWEGMADETRQKVADTAQGHSNEDKEKEEVEGTKANAWVAEDTSNRPIDSIPSVKQEPLQADSNASAATQSALHSVDGVPGGIGSELCAASAGPSPRCQDEPRAEAGRDTDDATGHATSAGVMMHDRSLCPTPPRPAATAGPDGAEGEAGRGDSLSTASAGLPGAHAEAGAPAAKASSAALTTEDTGLPQGTTAASGGISVASAPLVSSLAAVFGSSVWSKLLTACSETLGNSDTGGASTMVTVDPHLPSSPPPAAATPGPCEAVKPDCQSRPAHSGNHALDQASSAHDQGTAALWLDRDDADGRLLETAPPVSADTTAGSTLGIPAAAAAASISSDGSCCNGFCHCGGGHCAASPDITCSCC